jgi:hypothetical protein
MTALRPISTYVLGGGLLFVAQTPDGLAQQNPKVWGAPVQIRTC